MIYFCNMQQKIVLIGGPGTGKTTVINYLANKGFNCMPEISREVTIEAQKKGIEQLFLTKPLLFSEMLLEGRIQQHKKASELNNNIVFFDRGIPDVFAYMDYYNTDYPKKFKQKSNAFTYSKVFHFAPWKEIHTTDNERYESFEEAVKIDTFLTKAYTNLGYQLINVPFGDIEQRAHFILNSLSGE